MSVKSLRTKRRIDYKIFNSTGRRVLKVSPGSAKMAQLINEELQLVGKIDRFYVVNALPLLIDESDIRKAIEDIRALNDEYVDIHIRLKTELDADYNDSYPDYDDHLKNITDYIAAAVAEIKCRRDTQVKAGVEKTKDRLISEEKLFRDRIDQEIDSFDDLDSQFVEDLELQIGAAQALIEGYTSLMVRMKEADEEFSMEYTGTYDPNFQFSTGMQKSIGIGLYTINW